MQRITLAFVLACAAAYPAVAGTVQRPGCSPDGAGGCRPGVVAAPSVQPDTVTTGNGINYHGGPVMSGQVNAYFIWYGNWNGSGSNSQGTVSLINSLFGNTGLNNSGYFDINQTYGSNSANVSGSILRIKSTTDNYSRGTRLSDTAIRNVVSSAISSGRLPSDTHGIYFVITSSDVTATSGFCTSYCGWHTHASIGGADIKYSFIGNPDRCPSSCEAQTVSPNGNAGADGMASIMAHEAEEAASDPDLNAWFDSSGEENADKCAWKWGSLTGTVGNGGFNQSLAGKHWLIQMNWENSRGGGCAKTKGGSFFSR